MKRESLRARFVIAAALLVVTATVASVWSLAALSRLSGAMDSIVRDADTATAATARMAGALEREDDALLLVIAGDARGEDTLTRDRAETDAALDALAEADAAERALVTYRAAADRVVAEPDGPAALVDYHRDVNPPLRAAVAAIAAIRDAHFVATQRAAAHARDEVARARTITLVIAVAALAISVLVALRLARGVIAPLEATVAELQRLDRLRMEMIAVASHELRTPSTTLGMTLAMLRESSAELQPSTRALVETALIGATQLADTVDELLDLTRIEAGELRLAIAAVELGALVAETLPRWKVRADDAGVRLAARAPTVAVQGDRRRLRTVLDNLIDNAIKYGPRDTEVEVVVERAGERVTLAVTDRGPGVPAELRDQVFDKFFRVEHERRRAGHEPHGAGIGLYLCRQLVELHGGTIRCEPGADGRGARFVVELTSMQNA